MLSEQDQQNIAGGAALGAIAIVGLVAALIPVLLPIAIDLATGGFMIITGLAVGLFKTLHQMAKRPMGGIVVYAKCAAVATAAYFVIKFLSFNPWFMWPAIIGFIVYAFIYSGALPHMVCIADRYEFDIASSLLSEYRFKLYTAWVMFVFAVSGAIGFWTTVGALFLFDAYTHIPVMQYWWAGFIVSAMFITQAYQYRTNDHVASRFHELTGRYKRLNVC